MPASRELGQNSASVWLSAMPYFQEAATRFRASSKIKIVIILTLYRNQQYHNVKFWQICMYCRLPSFLLWISLHVSTEWRWWDWWRSMPQPAPPSARGWEKKVAGTQGNPAQPMPAGAVAYRRGDGVAGGVGVRHRTFAQATFGAAGGSYASVKPRAGSDPGGDRSSSTHVRLAPCRRFVEQRLDRYPSSRLAWCSLVLANRKARIGRSASVARRPPHFQQRHGFRTV